MTSHKAGLTTPFQSCARSATLLFMLICRSSKNEKTSITDKEKNSGEMKDEGGMLSLTWFMTAARCLDFNPEDAPMPC